MIRETRINYGMTKNLLREMKVKRYKKIEEQSERNRPRPR
jgi:hypothetical protein